MAEPDRFPELVYEFEVGRGFADGGHTRRGPATGHDRALDRCHLFFRETRRVALQSLETPRRWLVQSRGGCGVLDVGGDT